jgi:hypothetical protein
MSRYYPQGHGPRLDEDLRLLYDHMYSQQDKARTGKPSAPSAIIKPGGPSNTQIAGLNVRGIPPQSGASVTTLSKIPVLAYDIASGDITWVIPM